MAYQAIYRKWRPLVFEDLVGQTHVTRTLKNQIKNGTIAHAYLFCGTRGTGKTTAAKVFARAINCEHPKDGSPCNECETCRGILDGSIMDVSEIDAASNNGVDSIREIREDVHYAASRTKYRVYIIDEVHMLSAGAFNALLKTLEEPPEHVIFILATTEAYRVPETILSRCQRFDFKRIRPSDLVLRMKEIAVGDGFSVSEDAYRLLASLADGSMRDGLSILERCISACGKNLTKADIIAALGMADEEMVRNAAEAISSGNSETLLESVEMLSSEGRDLTLFLDSLVRYFRNLMVCKISDNPSALLDYAEEELIAVRAQAERISFEKISETISELSRAMSEAKWMKNPRIAYELALVKLAQPELSKTSDALLARIEHLEEQIKNGVAVSTVQTVETPKKKEPKTESAKLSARLYCPLDVSQLTAASPIVAAARKWDKIAQGIAKKYPFVASAVLNRKITIDGEGILLLFDKQEAMKKKIASTYRSQIREAFAKQAGEGLELKVVFEEDVADHLIDYWKIGGEPHAEDTPAEAEPLKEQDPLDTLCRDFPELVELTDESDFINYETESFSQTELEEENEEEEFLEENEKGDE